MDAPAQALRWGHVGVISTSSDECLLRDSVICGVNITNGGLNNVGAWPANNRAIYLPFEVQHPIVVKQMAWANGSTLTGTADAGVYSVDGRKLVSTGATSRSGSALAQVADVTDTLLMPGNYAMALLGSSSSGTYFRASSITGLVRGAGSTHEDVGSATLPSTTTFPSVGGTYIPWLAVIFHSVA